MPDSSFRTSLHRPDEPGIAEAWTDLLDRSEQATAFSHLAFGTALSDALGLEPRIAAVWDGDAIAAGALLFEKRVGPLKAAALPLFAQYVSPLLAAPPRETDVHHGRSTLGALGTLVGSSFDQASLVLHPSITDTRALQWAGWDVTPAHTYSLALQETERVASGWSGSARRTYRNEAEHYDLVEEAAHVGDALDLIDASHARQEHRLGIDRSKAETLMTTLAAKGLLRIFILQKDREPEAGLLVLSDGRTAHYWLAGSVPGSGMTVLVGHVLTRLRDEGVAYFDFGGANVPSIAEFKRKFGGTLTSYARARRVAHPLLRLSDRFWPR